MGLPEPSTAGTALVTGASSGIGAEIAKELARRGLHLTSVAGRGERLRSLSEEIAGKHGRKAEAIACRSTAPARLPVSMRRGPSPCRW